MSTSAKDAASNPSGPDEQFAVSVTAGSSDDLLKITVVVRYRQSAPSVPLALGVHLPSGLSFVAGSLQWSVTSGTGTSTRRYPDWAPTRHGALIWKSGQYGPGDMILIELQARPTSPLSEDAADDSVLVFALPLAANATATRAALRINQVPRISPILEPDERDVLLARTVFEHTAGNKPAAAKLLDSWIQTHGLEALDRPEDFYWILSDVSNLLRTTRDHRRRRDVACFVYNLPNDVPLTYRLHDIDSIADSSTQIRDYKTARLWANEGFRLIADSTEHEIYSIRFTYYCTFELIDGRSKKDWATLVTLVDQACAKFPHAQSIRPWFYFHIRAKQIRALFYLGDTDRAEREASSLLDIAEDDTLDESYRTGRAHVLLAASIVRNSEWRSPRAYRRKAGLAAHAVRLYHDLYVKQRELLGAEDELTIIAAKNVAYAMDRSKKVFQEHALGELKNELTGQLQDYALDVWVSNFGDVDLGGYLDWTGTLPS